MTGGAVSARREKLTWSLEELDAMTTEELLQTYKRTGNEELKWPLVMRYAGLVKTIALQVRGVYSSFAQVDDIINEGLLTLAGAVDKFDPDKGIKFETYVSKRIRGAVIDLARRQDWVPRSVRRKARDIDQASGELFAELGRYPTDQEMADRLGVSGAVSGGPGQLLHVQCPLFGRALRGPGAERRSGAARQQSGRPPGGRHAPAGAAGHSDKGGGLSAGERADSHLPLLP